MKLLVILLAIFWLSADAKSLEGRILNGNEATRYDAPYIVSVQNSHQCGGALIAPQWIITAGHCMKWLGEMVKAGIHEHGYYSVNPYLQYRYVDYYKVHEQYVEGSHVFDILIAHLREPFELTPYVQAVKLPAYGETPTGKATLYGWGQMEPNGNIRSDNLQYAETEVIDWKQCRDKLPKKSTVDETMICTNTKMSACFKDSGSPLVKKMDGETDELIGIVSWSAFGYIPVWNCNLSNYPSVYTQVSLYTHWITNVINSYNSKVE